MGGRKRVQGVVGEGKAARAGTVPGARIRLEVWAVGGGEKDRVVRGECGFEDPGRET